LNIQRAVFNILDDNIDDAFKVSDDPMLVGWNPSMELREMFDQIATTYGRPTPAALLQNDTLFRSVYSPNDAPEVLFRHIEDCQEVQILGEDPYTAQKLLNNAVRLLLQCGLYTRDFEDWDRKPNGDRIWINLKTFVQECYTRRLNASNITSGAQGYVQNAFTVLQEESEEEDDDVQTVITQMAALTTQSQLMVTMTAETSASVAAAINQLHANQQAMQQQFAAFTTRRNTTYQPAFPAMQPPIMQFSIPNLATFNTAGRGAGGRHGGQGRGGRADFGSNTGGRNARTPFANFVGRGGQGGLPPIGGGGGCGGGAIPFAQQPCHIMQRRCTRISSRHIRTGMYVFCVDLTSRTDIHRRHAPPLGDVRITKKVSIGITRDNTLERGTTHVPTQCTRVSCQICDGVGQSR